MKTTDTTFAAHLIQRSKLYPSYTLTGVDRTQERHAYEFAYIDREVFNREREWYDRNGIAEKRRVANALSALAKGDAIKPGTLDLWPCLAVAVEG